MCLKLCLVFLLLALLACGVVSLSTETKKSLEKGLRGKTLEQRKARLQNLSALYFGNRKKAVASSGAKNSSEAASELNSESGIEEINVKGGAAEYLFEADINLSEEQLDLLEKSISTNTNTRTKRQVAKYATLWPDNTVYYYFDPALDERRRYITKLSLNFLQSRTCIKFVQSETAVNRIRVFNGSGCYSSVGMVGGVQDLSLANWCGEIGLTGHEFIHALGVWHMQMRDDRDSYITVNLTNVPEDMHGNFVKVPSDQVINYTPYEYGSDMHYGSNTFATAGANSMIPLEGRFLRTLGTRVISFYDIKTINDHYKCIDQCKVAPAACTNGGEPNPTNCGVCNCPSGYAGNLCKQRPSGCGATLNATALWKVQQFTFGNASVTTARDQYLLCNHWISAPAGKKVQVRVTYIKDPKCQVGCRLNSIEPKIKADKRITNARICCNDLLNYILTSNLNPTPIVSYNRILASTYTFHYRYV